MSAAGPARHRSSFWAGFATRERLGWVVYDWANSAFVLCVVTVLGSAYFVGVFQAAARHGGATVGEEPALVLAGLPVTAEAAWSFVIAAAALLVAVCSPFLGAIADAWGARKRFLQAFCALGVAATAALWWGGPWWWVGLLILLGIVGFEGGNVYYNAFLPDIAGGRDEDMVSATGYAAGYVGGVLVLIAALAWFVPPRGDIHHAFLLIALWWGGFALVTFALLRERPGRPPAGGGGTLRQAARELARTVGSVRRYRNAGLFLLAFLLYNDGIATLISNVTPYALQNIYLDRSLTRRIGLEEMIGAIILVQVVAFPGAMLCGWLATRLGDKRALYLMLAVFTGVVAYGQVAQVVRELYVLAALIGLVLGGAQAVSRSLYSRFVPAGRNAEFFSFFALSQKFSAMFGPLFYGLSVLLTGSTRLALLSLVVFFVAGGAVLSLVNVQQGQAEAARR